MAENICNVNDICPECLEEEAEIQWLIYYDQYREALLSLIKSPNAGDLLIPIIYTTAHYLELWLKVIASDYGIGKSEHIYTKILKGHDIEYLFKEVINIIDWNEYEKVDDKLQKIWGIICDLLYWTSEEQCSLSESFRYPVTKDHKPTLNPCLMRYFSDECSKIDPKEIIKSIDELMALTYSVYEEIYSSRIG